MASWETGVAADLALLDKEDWSTTRVSVMIRLLPLALLDLVVFRAHS
jgi:hypothetical protein